MFEEFFNEEEQKKHEGETRYQRYKRIIWIHIIAFLFGVCCAIWAHYFPYGIF